MFLGNPAAWRGHKVVRPIRQAHGPEALEGQAHHPEQGRRTDGVPKGEKQQPFSLVYHWVQAPWSI